MTSLLMFLWILLALTKQSEKLFTASYRNLQPISSAIGLRSIVPRRVYDLT